MKSPTRLLLGPYPPVTTVCFLIFIFIFIVLTTKAEEDKKYTTKYDNIDIDSVIQNQRLLSSYVGCLLETKPCTPDAAELKTNLPDALATNCSSCSDAQRRISDKLSHYLIDHQPEEWSLLEERYDPTGAYRKRYLQTREIDEKDNEAMELEKDRDKESKN